MFQISLNAGVDLSWGSPRTHLARGGTLALTLENAERITFGAAMRTFIHTVRRTDSSPTQGWAPLAGIGTKQISAVTVVRNEPVISTCALF
jgi:hypothetical protein